MVSSSASSASVAAASASKLTQPKLASGPSSYTIAEMKSFVKVSKAIRNVSEKDGHTEVTASFIDSELSDNTGRVDSGN